MWSAFLGVTDINVQNEATPTTDERVLIMYYTFSITIVYLLLITYYIVIYN
jgi:hypothetical protein